MVKQYAPLLLLVCGICGTTLAADTSVINIKANIIASPCTIDTTSLTIDLGDIQAATLSSAGATSPWSAVNTIQLINCPASTSSARATFSGTPASNGDVNGYKNTGSEENISIQLADDAATPNYLSNGKSTDYLNVASNKVAFNVKARLYTSGMVMPGAVASTVNVAFDFK